MTTKLTLSKIDRAALVLPLRCTHDGYLVNDTGVVVGHIANQIGGSQVGIGRFIAALVTLRQRWGRLD